MGKIIVIDGLDGCGKATQTELVKKELIEMGYKVYSVSFPDYESLSSGPVRMHLNGEIWQNTEEINPYMCATLYAVDRGIQWVRKIKEQYDNGNIILCDRYISANVIYQGAKFDSKEDREKFFSWVYELETKYIQIPKEDITICLTLPVEVSQRLMSKRYSGDESKKDIYEKNLSYLDKCRNVLDSACDYLPNIGYNWVKLDCSNSDNTDIKPRDSITKEIMGHIKSIL